MDVPVTSSNEDVELAERGLAERGPPQKQMSFAAPRVHNDEDVEGAPRHGWLSGPCDCCLTIWAGIGDIIEGGADQLVGVFLLLISASITYVSGIYQSLWTPATAGEVEAVPTLVDGLMHQSNEFAQVHPAAFVSALLGGLVAIALAVLFEEDFRRVVSDLRNSLSGYKPLEKPVRAHASRSPPLPLL